MPIIKPCAICGAPVRRKPSHDAPLVACSPICGKRLIRLNYRATLSARLGEDVLDHIRRRYAAGESQKAIGLSLGIQPQQTIKLFADAGVEKRTYSEAVALQWVDNDARREQTSATFAAWQRANPELTRQRSIDANLILQQRQPTSIERRMASALEAAGITAEGQYLVGGKFLCDFAIVGAMIIIECDGTYWHSSVKQQRRDSSKDAYLRACGFRVFRFTDHEINLDIDACIAIITSALQELPT